jgi:sortase A
MARVGAVRWIERILWAAGFMVLGYCGMYWLNASLRQAGGNRELGRLLTARHAGIRPGERPTIPDGGLIGKVEIPELRLSAIVFQGAGDPELSEGVGHVDQSALPGQKGNVVLAAHRDSFFRGLRNIHRGDTIRITTEDGSRSYTVQSTEIVKPTDVAVMAPTPDNEVTLITCYPFYFVGHAPKRFIVHAREQESVEQASNLPPARPSPLVSAQTDEPDASSPAPLLSWETSLRHQFLFARQLFSRSVEELSE